MSHLSEFLEAQMVEEKHKNAYQFRQAFTAKMAITDEQTAESMCYRQVALDSSKTRI